MILPSELDRSLGMFDLPLVLLHSHHLESMKRRFDIPHSTAGANVNYAIILSETEFG